MDTLLRLAWALPLVLLMGVGLMLAMKRMMAAERAPLQAPALSKTLRLSEQTQAHVIDIDGTHYLVIESQCNVLVEAVASKVAPPGPVMNPLRARLLLKGRPTR